MERVVLFFKNAWFTVSIAFFTWQPVMSGCCSLIKQPLEVSTPNSMDLQEKLLYTHFFSSFWKYWSTCPQRSLVFLCFSSSFTLVSNLHRARWLSPRPRPWNRARPPWRGRRPRRWHPYKHQRPSGYSRKIAAYEPRNHNFRVYNRCGEDENKNNSTALV